MICKRRFRRALVLGALGLLAVSGARAGELRIGGVLPNGGLVSSPVVSMRAMRFTDMVPQHTDFSCGAAALATILKYAYGREVTEAQVIRGMLKVSNPALVRAKGFSLLDMKHYVETIGFRGRGYKIAPQVLDRVRIPVIVLLDIRGYKHFVVFEKTAGDEVYIGDPALGNRSMSRRRFLADWNGVVFAVIGRGFIRDTVLLNPRPAPTARRLVNEQTVVTNTQLIDFGFTRADLF